MNREHADLTASEVCDAIGLNYGMSRAQLWKVLKRGEAKPAQSPMLVHMLQQGKELEHITFGEYAFQQPLTLARPNERDFGGIVYGVGEMLDNKSYQITARPDGFAASGMITVELKTVINGQVPDKPKPAHLAQCVTQLFCCKPAVEGHLFYFKPSTGEWRLFVLHWNPGAWEKYLVTWILEFLQAEDAPPPRMPNGEAERRSAILLEAFWHEPRNPSSDGPH